MNQSVWQFGVKPAEMFFPVLELIAIYNVNFTKRLEFVTGLKTLKKRNTLKNMNLL